MSAPLESSPPRRAPGLLGLVALVVALVVLALVWRGASDSSAPEAEASERGQDANAHGPSRAAADVATPDVAGLGPGRILGAVTDFESRPVANAQVCARRGRVHVHDLRPRCATTDAEGRYELLELAPGEYQVHASAAEHQPFDQDVDVRPGTQSRADFELLGGAVLVRGLVADLAGGAIEGAIVTLRGDGVSGDPRGTALVQTDAEGRFTAWVRRGRLHIYGSAEGYATRNLYSSAPGPSLEIYLVPEVVLVGRVVDAETGAGVAGVEVHPGHDALGETPFVFASTHEGWTRSDADGKFRITGLSPGAYRPFVVHAEHRGEAREAVQLGLGETSELLEIPVRRAARVRARVVDERGSAACLDGSATASPRLFELLSAPVDGEGFVELSGLRPGDYEVNLNCAGRMFKEVATFRVAEGAVLDDQVWTIASGARLRGIVVDGGGQPIPRVVVVAKLQPGADDGRGPTARTSRSEPSDKFGGFELVGLEPGRYELDIGGSAGPKLPEPVEVELGTEDLDGVRLETPVPGTIRGRVVDESGVGVANLTVSAYGQTGGGFQDGRSDDAGAFELAGLGPGEYRVTALDGRWQVELGETKVALEPGGQAEAEIVVELGAGTIRGRVVDDGGTPLDDAFVSLTRQTEALDKRAPSGRFSYADFQGRPILSDVDGSFEATGLPAGLYTVYAKQKQGGEGYASDVRPGQRVEIVIPAVASLAGTVVLADSGELVPDYAITATHADGQFSARDQWREHDGSWRFERIPPGTYTLVVSSPLGDAQTQIELAPGAAQTGLRVELEPRVHVRGQVVDARDGRGIADAELRITAPGASSGGVGFIEWIKTDADGRFAATVPAGSLPIRILPAGSAEGRKHGSLRATIEVSEEPDQELPAFELEPRDDAGL